MLVRADQVGVLHCTWIACGRHMHGIDLVPHGDVLDFGLC